MPENDSVLDDLNMGCVDCQESFVPFVQCSTTTFTAAAPAAVTGVVAPIAHEPYTVCCDPVAIKPVNQVVCSRGVVKNFRYEVDTLPTKGKLFIGDEEVQAGDILTEQENGLLVYVRTIDEDAVDGVQPADTDSFNMIVLSNVANSAALVINLVLEEVSCVVPSPCGGCNC